MANFMSELVEKGLRAKRESKYVDFKRQFDPASAGEWCEIIKDVVAMANSGGPIFAISCIGTTSVNIHPPIVRMIAMNESAPPNWATYLAGILAFTIGTFIALLIQFEDMFPREALSTEFRRMMALGATSMYTVIIGVPSGIVASALVAHTRIGSLSRSRSLAWVLAVTSIPAAYSTFLASWALAGLTNREDLSNCRLVIIGLLLGIPAGIAASAVERLLSRSVRFARRRPGILPD